MSGRSYWKREHISDVEDNAREVKSSFVELIVFQAVSIIQPYTQDCNTCVVTKMNNLRNFYIIMLRRRIDDSIDIVDTAVVQGDF